MKKNITTILVLLKTAVEFHEMDKIEEILKSNIDDYHLSNFGRIIDLPVQDFKKMFKLTVHKENEFLIRYPKISTLLRDSAGQRKIKTYFNVFHYALKRYIENQVKDYIRYSGKLQKNRRNNIINGLEFILNNFLVNGWENKIHLPDNIVDKLLGFFELTNEAKKILNSWREI